MRRQILEIIQCNGVAVGRHFGAGIDQRRVGFDIFENFDRRGCFGQQKGNPLLQQVLGKIDKGLSAPGQSIEPDGEKGVDQQVRGGHIPVDVGNIIGRSVTKQEFVGEDFLVFIEYGLTGDVNIFHMGFYSVAAEGFLGNGPRTKSRRVDYRLP